MKTTKDNKDFFKKEDSLPPPVQARLAKIVNLVFQKVRILNHFCYRERDFFTQSPQKKFFPHRVTDSVDDKLNFEGRKMIQKEVRGIYY